jgi:hypothetical protein
VHQARKFADAASHGIRVKDPLSSRFLQDTHGETHLRFSGCRIPAGDRSSDFLYGCFHTGFCRFIARVPF